MANAARRSNISLPSHIAAEIVAPLPSAKPLKSFFSDPIGHLFLNFNALSSVRINSLAGHLVIAQESRACFLSSRFAALELAGLPEN